MRSLALILVAILCPGEAAAGDLPVERMYDAPALHGPTLRQARFSPDGKLISYLRARDDAPTVSDLWAYEIARGENLASVSEASVLVSRRTASAAGCERSYR